MQKKLIAAAIAGLIAVPALAQTNVTISGRVAAGWESYKQKDCDIPATCSTDNESRISDQSSRIIFNVTEDLGGGLSAWAQLDSRFGVDTSASGGWNGGNTGLGLMHKQWGKFTLGHWDVHYQELTPLEASRAGSLQTLLGNGMLSQVSVAAPVTIANGTRSSNLMMWDSPNWNGFTGRLVYSTGFAAASSEGSGLNLAGTGNPGGGDAWSGTVRYNNGPWAAGLSYWHGEAESRIPASPIDQSSWRAWLGYTFAMGLKIGFAYDRSTLENASPVLVDLGGDLKRSAWMIPVSYRWGPHAVYGNYARANDASNTTGVSTGASAWSLGYDYAFSKRTSAGIFYTQYNNKEAGAYNMFALGANGATPNVLGMDSRQWYIGMAHNF